MIPALRRDALPRTILTILPVLIFLPQAVLHTGVILFIISLVFSGGHRQKGANIAMHPLLFPVLSVFAVTVVVAATQAQRGATFWSAFAHYQIYVILLLFLAVGGGEWQRRAAKVFLGAGVFAATLFYLRYFGLLPEVSLFENYHEYSGNNSILIGIMLAIVSGMFLFDSARISEWRGIWWRIALFAYVGIAVLFFARTRTGSLIFFFACGVAFLWLLNRSWHRALALLVCIGLVAAIAWQLSPTLRDRTLHTLEAAKAALVTESTDRKDIRIELYELAAGMVDDKPLLGHGIGQWRPLNESRAASAYAKLMATPHNDYLLYAAEIGLIGLGAFLWVWTAQLRLGARLGGVRGAWLVIVTSALLITGAFNAVLRDLVFGMPFMVLLAIPLAGLVRGKLPNPAARVAGSEAVGG